MEHVEVTKGGCFWKGGDTVTITTIMLYWLLLTLIMLMKIIVLSGFHHIRFGWRERKRKVWVRISSSDIARVWRMWKCLGYNFSLGVNWECGCRTRGIASFRMMATWASCRTGLKSACISTQRKNNLWVEKQSRTIFLIFNFYSVTIVCIFSPSVHPTPASPTSLPHLYPPPWFCPCVLYSSSHHF